MKQHVCRIVKIYLLCGMETKEQEQVKLKEVLTSEHELILYNDDVNTFDHVIDCLVKICGHSVHQAEQCAYIVHYKGKCTIKQGNYRKLVPMMLALQEEQLSAEIK